MLGTGIIKKFSNQLESPEKIQHILPTAAKHKDEIKVTRLRNWGHYRKMIVNNGNKRYLVYASFYPKYIRKIVFLLTMLSENKVKVPSIMALHAGLHSMLTKKGCYLVLEYVSGKRADNNNHYKNTGFIAENIGRMHAISAAEPGYLLMVHNNREEIIRLHEYAWPKMLKLLEKHPEFIWELPVEQCNRWFGEKTVIWGQGGPFYLLHGDPNPGNIIIQENSKAVLIDYEKSHYGYPGPELFRCLMANYCTHSLEHQLLFLDTYRQYVSKENWLLWENNTAAIAGFGILKRMNTWFKKSQILRERGKIKNSRIILAQNLDYWNWLQDIITTFPDGRGDWPSIIALYLQENATSEKNQPATSHNFNCGNNN